MNREELDCYLRQSTPREKEVLQGIPLEELHRQDTCRFAKAGQGTYLFEESLFMAPGEKIVVSRQDRCGSYIVCILRKQRGTLFNLWRSLQGIQF